MYSLIWTGFSGKAMWPMGLLLNYAISTPTAHGDYKDPHWAVTGDSLSPWVEMDRHSRWMWAVSQLKAVLSPMIDRFYFWVNVSSLLQHIN